MKYYETGSFDPSYNLAFEEYLLANKTEGDILVLWQNDRTVVVGMNQNAEAEINRDYIEKNGIQVVRRKTGGGAVYHDLGNLNYSFISDTGPLEEMSILKYAQPVCDALAKLGVNASLSGRNDILVEGRKVSGVAQRVLGKRILHHGTLLYSIDEDAVAGALNADTEKFKSKSTKSVRSRICNLKDYLPKNTDVEDFKNAILAELAGNELDRSQLTSSELERVMEMSDLYRSWEWTYGRSPKYEFTSKKRFPGGTLCVSADIKSGIINEIIFTGDFLSTGDISELEGRLCGCRFEKRSISELLSGIELAPYLGGITSSDVLEVLFSKTK